MEEKMDTAWPDGLERPDEVVRSGSWPDECRHRAFVEGVAWWQYQTTGATMLPSERDDAEAEALRRYGEPAKQPSPAAEYRFTFDPALLSDEAPFVSDPVRSQELAEGQMNMVARYTLHLHEASLMPENSNYGYLEKREPGGAWEEMEEDDL